MKYLVTGGAGFIGSHLVDRLLTDDNKVVVIDNFSTGKPKNLPDNDNLDAWDRDITGKIEDLFKGVEIVYHLAALTRPRESFKCPKKTHKVNVDGTKNILEACVKNKVKKIIFVSSASTYGFKKRFPIKESDIQEPISPYAKSKVTGEGLCRIYATKFNIDIGIVRPFNVFGRRQDPSGPYGAAVPKFIEALKTGKKPFITGDGNQFRDFIYIDDLIDLLIIMSKKPLNGQAFNAGLGKPATINELYKLISKIMDKDIKPRMVKEIKEPNTHASVRKGWLKLRWGPRDSLESGLRKMI